METKTRFSLPVRLLLLAVVVSIVAAVVWLILYGIGTKQLGNDIEACKIQRRSFHALGGVLVQTKDFVECLDRRAGLLAWAVSRQDHLAIKAMPSLACRYIGIWQSSRNGKIYDYWLNADATFTVAPESASGQPTDERYTGIWSVYGEKMSWLPDSGRIYPPDRNSIRNLDDSHFLLVEEDGIINLFSLKQRLPAKGCPQNGPG
ncbi:MAG: hypothetical protein IPJ25_07205 [Rhodocyclaceae bacterium]|nr:hypothetical protein [Rhodocyclaceae bacterium]